MIITEQKTFEEVLKKLQKYNKIFVVGCAACATKCQTGGEEAVKKRKQELEEKGKKVTGSIVLDTPCDIRIVQKDLVKNKEANDADAILVMACGAGIQAIEKKVDKILIPALNPVFVGTVQRIGMYNEFCALCGDCIIEKTGDICPISRCAKGMVNGPCGGAVDGKCEIDFQRDCAWILIFDKLKKKNKEKEILDNKFTPRKFKKPYKIENRK